MDYCKIVERSGAIFQSLRFVALPWLQFSNDVESFANDSRFLPVLPTVENSNLLVHTYKWLMVMLVFLHQPTQILRRPIQIKLISDDDQKEQ